MSGTSQSVTALPGSVTSTLQNQGTLRSNGVAGNIQLKPLKSVAKVETPLTEGRRGPVLPPALAKQVQAEKEKRNLQQQPVAVVVTPVEATQEAVDQSLGNFIRAFLTCTLIAKNKVAPSDVEPDLEAGQVGKADETKICNFNKFASAFSKCMSNETTIRNMKRAAKAPFVLAGGVAASPFAVPGASVGLIPCLGILAGGASIAAGIFGSLISLGQGAGNLIHGDNPFPEHLVNNAMGLHLTSLALATTAGTLLGVGKCAGSIFTYEGKVPDSFIALAATTALAAAGCGVGAYVETIKEAVNTYDPNKFFVTNVTNNKALWYLLSLALMSNGATAVGVQIILYCSKVKLPRLKVPGH